MVAAKVSRVQTDFVRVHFRAAGDNRREWLIANDMCVCVCADFEFTHVAGCVFALLTLYTKCCVVWTDLWFQNLGN